MTNRIVSVDETFTLPAPVRAKIEADLTATSPGDNLAMLVRNPSTQEQYGNLNGSTVTALAPGILVVTFIAPATGAVTVQMEAQIHQCTVEGGFWALQDGGATVPGSLVRVTGPVALDQGGRAAATVHVAGLTPGVSYTYAWASASNGPGTFQMRAGGTGTGSASSGPALMVVRIAPGV